MGSPLQVGPPPPVDLDETYKDLKIRLRECCDMANDLQETYAKKVIQDKKTIRIKKQTETQYSMMTPLSFEEAEQILNDTKKGKYWFKRSKTIIRSVINRLKDVKKHGNVSTDQQNPLSKVIGKLETDCLQLLNPAINYNQPINDFDDTQLTDEDETDRSSEGKHNDSSNSSGYGVETGKNGLDRRCVQIEDFGLLFTCTLILETEGNNYSQICNYII